MADIWLDYSGARPDPHDMNRLGVKGVLRYLSEPIAATAWKRITPSEKDAILAAGLDLVLNFEWFEGRMLGGYDAGKHDGGTALAQAQALGYPQGASIYFSHDTSANDDTAVLAYMRGVRDAFGGYYEADIYSGLHVVQLVVKAGLAKFGWQTVAWSNGLVGDAHLYQNGKRWYSGGADENEVLHAGLGSWLDHEPVPPSGGGSTGDGGGGGTSGGGGAPSGLTYTVKSGDTLAGIASQFGLSLTEIEALNPQIKNPNLIYVGEVLTVKAASDGGSTHPKPHPHPHPHPKPVPTGKYTVQSGDNLTFIAQRYHTTVRELVKLNPRLAAHPNLLKVGWLLNVPGGSTNKPPAPPKVTHYRVVQGDTLADIAKRYGTTVKQLHEWNKSVIKNPNLIRVGWVLRVA